MSNIPFRQTLYNAANPRTITSTTDATPIVVTLASHGYSTGDRVTVFGHTTNTNANGTWTVTKVNANTFSLDDSIKTGGGAGGNDGCLAPEATVISGFGYDDISLTFDTDGGGDAAMTVKVVASNSETKPDFAAYEPVTSSFDYVQISDGEDGSTIDGDDGFVVATADDNRVFTLNCGVRKWISVIATAGTAGELTVKALCRSKNNN